MADLAQAIAERDAHIGERYGLLTIVDSVRTARGFRAICRCDCGGERTCIFYNLRTGLTRSCGCLIGANFRGRSGKHGHSIGGARTPEHAAWTRLRQVCLNQNNPRFPDYGGRGIKVCERWGQFSNFLSDMGKRPAQSMSIDRIDVNGNYEPSNCRWATQTQQARNTRRNKLTDAIAAEIRKLATQGIKKTEISKMLGVNYASVKNVAAGKSWI